jgi:D-alanine-D-alanine ligase
MKQTVAVIFGGKSAEHDVSIITAHTPIIDSLVATGEYTVVPVYIAKDGAWYSDPAMLDIAYFKQGAHEAKIKNLTPLRLEVSKGLTLVFPSVFPKSVSIDVVFPAMHGTYGEDGSLMGLLRMANVPFVGCDMAASAVAMDKVLTKQVLAAEGVPVVPYVWFTKHEWEEAPVAIMAEASKLAYPLFVKPVHLGSSIGISKVTDEAGLKRAIEVALHFDDKVLVEEGVQHLVEVTLPIMGNHDLTLGAIERPLNKTEFFNFEDKYLSQGKGTQGANSAYSEIPAAIAPERAHEVAQLGEKTYRTLGCTGIARVDFLIDSVKGTVFVNEVNTLPGSLYHHNWKHVGVSSVALVTKLIALALERAKEGAELTHTFQSSILNNMKPKGTA